MTESVVDLLGELHAERVRTWPPEQLKGNIEQRRLNVERFDPATAPQAGDVVEPFELEDVEGGVIRSRDLVKNGPAVLVFFRHQGCPACNIALPYYARNLWPTLNSLGVPLVAVSPQIASVLVDIRRRHDFAFKVASDNGARLGRRFGITFQSEGPVKPESVAQGLGEFPHPSIFVIDAGHVVRFADVTPNWMARTEAEPVIAAVRATVEAPRVLAQV
jgi:peroxiredoxin